MSAYIPLHIFRCMWVFKEQKYQKKNGGYCDNGIKYVLYYHIIFSLPL